MLRQLLVFLFGLYCLVIYHRGKRGPGEHRPFETYNISERKYISPTGNELVSFEGTDIPRRVIFDSINSQTGLMFYYCNNDFDDKARVSLNVVNTSLNGVLTLVLTGTSIRWSFFDDHGIHLYLVKPFSPLIYEDWAPFKTRDIDRLWIFSKM